MRYSKSFERDYKWYLHLISSDKFNFSGNANTLTSKGLEKVIYNPEGKSAKECFYTFDSRGERLETKEPNLLRQIYHTKASVNLHIKMYSEDRALGLLPKIMFDQICTDIKAPDWFSDAVENQKYKYYPTDINVVNRRQ